MTYKVATPESIAAARAAMDQIESDKIAAAANLKMLTEKWRDAQREWILLETLWRGYSSGYKAGLGYPQEDGDDRTRL